MKKVTLNFAQITVVLIIICIIIIIIIIIFNINIAVFYINTYIHNILKIPFLYTKKCGLLLIILIQQGNIGQA